MYRYFYIGNPPAETLTQPLDWWEKTPYREPRRVVLDVGTFYAYGEVDFPRPLSKEEIQVFQLMPEDKEEAARYLLWMEYGRDDSLTAEVLTDFLAEDEEWLSHWAERNFVFRLALVIKNEMERAAVL